MKAERNAKKSSSLEERWIISGYRKNIAIHPICQVCNTVEATFWVLDNEKEKNWYMWMCSTECFEYWKLREC